MCCNTNKTVFPGICKTFTWVFKLLWSARSISFWARLDIHVVCSIVDWKQLMGKRWVSRLWRNSFLRVFCRLPVFDKIGYRLPCPVIGLPSLHVGGCFEWESSECVLAKSPVEGYTLPSYMGNAIIHKIFKCFISGWSFGQPLWHCGRFSSTVKHRPIADLDIWGRLIFLKLIGCHKVNHFLIKVESLADDWRLV